MAALLYRLAHFAFRRRILVSLIWAAVLVTLGIGAGTLSGQLSNAVTIPGTESQQAIDNLKARFPEAKLGGASARVVIEAPAGQKITDPANEADARQLVSHLKQLPKAAAVTDPFTSGTVSPDGRVALAQISYGVQASELTAADRTAVTDSLTSARQSGLTVEVGGDVSQASPTPGATEGIGVLIAAIVLTVTFGSLLAAGLPLLTALLGVGVGMAGLYTVSGFVDLNSNAPILALMLGLAVGIDYALFIVSRYGHELADGKEPREAVAHSVGTAGSAVVFAGLTVIIALAGLTVVGIPFLGQMGIAAAGTVAVAVLIALTLLPAVLGFAGRKLLPKRRKENAKATNGERWARFVANHRVPVLIVSVLGLLVVAVPALSMRLGLPNDATAAPDSTQRKAYDIVAESFGPGMSAPLVVTLTDASTGDAMQAADRIARLGDVAMVTPPKFNQPHDTAMFTVIPKSGPSDQRTEDLVSTIRGQAGGTKLAVTGQTALQIDVSEKLAGAMVPYLALIVGLAFLLLMLVFRSILVPLKATLGFLGTVAATLGAVVAVFQWGWLDNLLGVESTGPIMSMLPILLVGVLFGLAMDYQVFLVTRMREEHVHGAPAPQSMITGFRHGSRVVVAAALIMISVFAGFVLDGTTLIQSIGFALAFGVLVDAFVVRMTIVPAVMALLGKGAWWLPRWLDRALPNVDVEGERLAKRLREPETARV